MIVLDTNVLFYALDRKDPEKQRIARDILDRALDRTDLVRLSLQVVGELYWALTRKRIVSRADALEVVRVYLDTFQMLASTRGDFEKALDAVGRHGLQIWDALVWATADDAGCTYLISEDFQDGRRLGSVTFINPFNPDNRELLDAALPPKD